MGEVGGSFPTKAPSFPPKRKGKEREKEREREREREKEERGGKCVCFCATIYLITLRLTKYLIKIRNTSVL